VDRVAIVRELSSELANKWKVVGRTRTTSDLKNACVEAWKRGGIPVAVHACVSYFISSSDFLPLADHPMTNPRCFMPSCAGCGSMTSLTHRFGYPFSECYPTKQGVLMSELVHASAGMVVLPHAMPTPDAPDYAKTCIEHLVHAASIKHERSTEAPKFQVQSAELRNAMAEMDDRARTAEFSSTSSSSSFATSIDPRMLASLLKDKQDQ
jgi:hypothetical protein